MTTRKIKLAAAQMLAEDDVRANGRKIAANIREAHRQKCRIVLFHEGCLTNYPNARRAARLDYHLVAREERKIQRLAGRLGIAVLLGTTSRRDGKAYNDVMIVEETGRCLGRYAKTWRAGEEWYTAGPGPVIFRVAGVDGTVIICHDLRYPELVRLGVAAGAQIVFIANNESGLAAENKQLGYRSMQIARATENCVFSVMCNAPADPVDLRRPATSHGNSKIADPLGNVLDEAGHFEQRLVVATCNLKEADRHTPLRTLGKLSGTEDRYGVTCENPAYAEWIRAGLKLVRRLDGKDTAR